jgi:hypothetical protein
MKKKILITTLADPDIVWAVLKNTIGLKIKVFDYTWGSYDNYFIKVKNDTISLENYQILEEVAKNFFIKIKYFTEPYPIMNLKTELPERIKLVRSENYYRFATFFLGLFSKFGIELFPEKNKENREFIKLLKKNNPPLYEKCKVLFHLESQ